MPGGDDVIPEEYLDALAAELASGAAPTANPAPETDGPLSSAEIAMIDELDAETPAIDAASAAAKWPRRHRTEEGKRKRRDADALRKVHARAEARALKPQVLAPAPYAALAGRVLRAQERAKKEAVIRRGQLMKALEEPGSDKVLQSLRLIDAPRLDGFVRVWLVREMLRAKEQSEPTRETIASHISFLRGRTAVNQRVLVGRLLKRAEHLEKTGVWSPFDLLAIDEK